MEGAGADLHVIGLQDDAALLRPEALQRQDQPLEGARRLQRARTFWLRHAAFFAGLFGPDADGAVNRRRGRALTIGDGKKGQERPLSAAEHG